MLPKQGDENLGLRLPWHGNGPQIIPNAAPPSPPPTTLGARGRGLSRTGPSNTLAAGVNRFQGAWNGGPSTRVSNEEIEARTADVLRRREDIYQENYLPAVQGIIQSLDEDTAVERAGEDADALALRSAAREKRTLSRYGISRNAIETQEADNSRKLATALDRDDAVNNARATVKERRTTLRNALIDLGRGVEDSATSTASSLASGAADRLQAEDTLKTQNSIAKRQNTAQLASTALLLFALA